MSKCLLLLLLRLLLLLLLLLLLQLLSWQECVIKLQDLLGGPETLQLLQLLRSELALNR